MPAMIDEHPSRYSGDVPLATYANYCEVGHNAFEFVFHFGQLYAETSVPVMHTRVVTSPTYAQAFCKTILESLGRYEQTFGSIPNASNDK